MFDKVELPLMKRIYPQLVSKDLVSVQPLMGPSGLVHYLRFRYSQNKGNQEQQEEPVRTKKVKPKKYHPIDEPWEV